VERSWREAVRDLNDALSRLQVAERLQAEREVESGGKLGKLERERDELQEELGKLKRTLKSHSQVHHRNLLGQVSEREKDLHELRGQYKELQDVYVGERERAHSTWPNSSLRGAGTRPRSPASR
jgi:DNA repair exonuclease SbcCD ATPase subunit